MWKTGRIREKSMFCHGMTDRSAIREGRALSRPYMRPRRSAALPCAALPCAVDTVQVTVTEQVTTSTAQVAPPVTPPVDDLILKALLALKTGDKGNAELLLDIGINDRKRLRVRYLKPAIEMGYIVPTMPDNPRSPTQKYRLTEKGRSVVGEAQSKSLCGGMV